MPCNSCCQGLHSNHPLKQFLELPIIATQVLFELLFAFHLFLFHYLCLWACPITPTSFAESMRQPWLPWTSVDTQPSHFFQITKDRNCSIEETLYILHAAYSKSIVCTPLWMKDKRWGIYLNLFYFWQIKAWQWGKIIVPDSIRAEERSEKITRWHSHLVEPGL